MNCLENKKLCQLDKCDRHISSPHPSCGFKHILVDSNIFLNYLETRNSDTCTKFIDNEVNERVRASISYTSFAEIFKKLQNELKKEDKPEKFRINEAIQWCMNNIIDKFTIIPIDCRVLELYNKLNDLKKSIRCESHDWINIAIASTYNLIIVSYDTNLKQDLPSINAFLKKIGYKSVNILRIEEL